MLATVENIMRRLAQSAASAARPKSEAQPGTTKAPAAKQTRQRGVSRSKLPRAGQSLVEFALVLPVLLLVILGGVAALQITMAKYTVAQAARAAAHQAALIGSNDPEVKSLAQELLDGGFGTSSKRQDGTDQSITVICPPSGTCRRYQPIQVTITYKDKVWVPIGPFDEFEFTVTATRASENDAGAPGAGGVCSVPGC